MDKLVNNKRKFLDIIQRLVYLNKISHAYLIEVDDVEDDIDFVLTFVKMILCTKKDKSVSDLGNCENCNICKLVDSNNYLDLKFIESDGNFIKKKQLMELQQEYKNKSLLGNKRIYIIKDADKLNMSSANTILKFLEEPEDDIVAILLTTNRYKILETILSRCQVLSLKSNVCQKAISNDILELLRFIVEKNALFIKYNEIVSMILPDKVIAKEKLEIIQNVLIDYLNYSADSINFNCSNEVSFILKNSQSNDITRYIAIIEEEMRKLEYNVNYKLWLDGLFARLIGD